MQNLTITLSQELNGIVTEHDVRNMLKAVNADFYVEEIYIDEARLKLLMERARAVEANRNRFVEAWEIAFTKLK